MRTACKSVEAVLPVVTQFAKKTGDFISLSVNDYEVLALSYTLIKNKGMHFHLRDSPAPPKTHIPQPRGANPEDDSMTHDDEEGEEGEEEQNDENEDWDDNIVYPDFEDTLPEHLKQGEAEANANTDSKEDAQENGGQGSSSGENRGKEGKSKEVIKESKDTQGVSEVSTVQSKDANPQAENLSNKTDGLEGKVEENKQGKTAEESPAEDGKVKTRTESVSSEMFTKSVRTDLTDNEKSHPQLWYENRDFKIDQDEGWINPSNLKNVLQGTHVTNEDQFLFIGVGVMTSDYAMQNILLQMGVPLLAVDGMMIKRVKNFVMECFSCFKICRDVTKVFCPNCGHDTLLKVTCAFNVDGSFILYKKKNKNINLRGRKVIKRCKA